MKRVLALVATVLLITAASWAQKAGADDAPLQQTVQRQLASDPAFAGVHAQAQNGKVTLTGSVATKNDKRHVEDLVKSVPGVTGVKDHLRVATGEVESPSKPNPARVASSTSPAKSSGSGTGGGAASVDTGNGGANTPNNAPDNTGSNSKTNEPTNPHGGTPQLIAWVQQPAGSSGAVAQGSRQSGQSMNASPSADQGESAYGNNTYSMGAQPGPKPNNTSPTQANSANTPGSNSAGNTGPGGSSAATGTPSASHGSSGRTGTTSGNGASASPSTVSPGNGNSPSSAPTGQNATSTGTPSPHLIPLAGPGGAYLVYASFQEPNPTPAQAHDTTAGQSQSSAGPTPSTVRTAPSDSELQSEIQGALRNDASLSSSQLSVRVSGDTIELSGSVPSAKEKLTAERLARSYAIDRKLDDKQLMVAGQSAGPVAAPVSR